MLRARVHAADSRSFPTAIIAWNDYIAAKVLQECFNEGIRVPQQLSVIGYGNFDYDDILTPPLTSVDEQTEAFGEFALGTLQLIIEHQRDGIRNEPQEYTFTPKATVIKRASCSAP